jgi:hypothetical protein
MRVVALPLLQIPLLVGLVISVRRMLMEDSPRSSELARGGTMWFTDLTAPDSKAWLPLASLVLLLANFQLSSAGGRGGGLLQLLRNVMQAGGVVALPFYSELPAGVFMYWIPNSAFSLAQTTIMRRFYPMPVTKAAARAAPATSEAARPMALTSEAVVAPLPQGNAPNASVEPVHGMNEEERELRGRISANPIDVEAHVQLSKTLLRTKRPADAVAHLWPAVQATPQETSGPLRFQLALALSLQEQHDVAEPLLEQVLMLEPDFVDGLLCLCATKEAQGKADEAIAALERVAALRPDLKSYCDREAARISAARGVKV